MYKCKLVALNKSISILCSSSQGCFPNDRWDRYGKSRAILTTSGSPYDRHDHYGIINAWQGLGQMTHCILGHVLRKEQCSKQARVLAALQAPSLKKWREFRRSWKQDAGNLKCFLIFSVTTIFSPSVISVQTHFFHKPSLHIAPCKLHSR